MPAVSSRLYTVNKELSLDDLHSKLSDVELKEETKVYGEKYELRTLITDLHWGVGREVLSGTLLFETLQGFPQIDGKWIYLPVGMSAPFSFFYEVISLYLVPFANKYRAEKIAEKMSYILTMDEDVPHPIVFNCFIPTRVIEGFLRTHSHTIKHCGWSDLDFIGVNKSSLGGVNVMQFAHSQVYNGHGKKSFVLLELHDRRWVIRISKEGIITFYTSVKRDEALDFIRKEIISLLP